MNLPSVPGMFNYTLHEEFLNFSIDDIAPRLFKVNAFGMCQLVWHVLKLTSMPETIFRIQASEVNPCQKSWKKPTSICQL